MQKNTAPACENLRNADPCLWYVGYATAPNAQLSGKLQKGIAVLWHTQRRAKILAILRESANARTAAIAEELGVSRETIRRDLLAMQDEGLLARVHGGAITADQDSEADFQKRKTLNWAEKSEIGRKALQLVEPGMTVFVDAGTTTMAFARALRDGPDVQVITNSVDVAQTLRRHSILVGGTILSDVPATFGELTLAEIGRFMADLAILSPTAVHPKHGVMYYELHEAEVARAMGAKTSKVAILADSSKLDRTSRVLMSEVGNIDWLVTDAKADPGVRQALADLIPAVL
ncbi:DeoR/GlpR transcriptional regulator [Oceaniradius stylonematis]|uniref:DeoR/GlpR transcriptional regulator n=1 Tax=Oceaniradius stylonematis TaxID=2184161 RepID=A0A3A8AE62_9HYPH|nr:DeoR/GlpR transcriptional regulator [Oceaniradius stylonematis]